MLKPIWAAALITFSLAAYAQDKIETVAEGLDHPWSLAFLPSGEMLVTERSGALRMVRDGTLASPPIAGVPPVFANNQGGMFDVVLDPEFASNRQLYLSYAHGTRKQNTLRVMRAVLKGDSLVEQQVIFTAVPWKTTGAHYGARMAFLPDGTLLLTTGDGYNYREQAQTLDNHFGKVIRINTDGSVPKDNPFVGKAGHLPEIYSYGHRNPQGLVVIDNGEIYLHEHGPKGGDELNHIQKGLNYGWPAISYGIDYSGALITPYTELPEMEQPLTYWVPSIAPSGMAFHQGGFYVGALKERTVHRLEWNGKALGKETTLFSELGQRIRDVRSGPDGYLYLLTDTDSGKVLRVKQGD
jgi:glucose/arabinose dehydrogenase